VASRSEFRQSPAFVADRSELGEDSWEVGGVPRDSFVSPPLGVHSPSREDLVAWQGRVTNDFVDLGVDSLETYLR